MDLIEELKQGIITANDLLSIKTPLYLSSLKMSINSLNCKMKRKSMSVIIAPSALKYFDYYKGISSGGEVALTYISLNRNLHELKGDKILKSPIKFKIDKDVKLYRTEQEAIENYYKSIEEQIINNSKYDEIIGLIDEYNNHKNEEKEKGK